MPAQPPFDPNEHGRTGHIVAKTGAKTALIVGITNEIEAVRRIQFESETGGPIVAFHMLVVGLNGGNFPQPGDSGAYVFDTTGRVMGVVDAGVASSKVMRCMRKYNQGDG